MKDEKDTGKLIDFPTSRRARAVAAQRVANGMPGVAGTAATEADPRNPNISRPSPPPADEAQ
jgi:hypothetical protein